VGEALLFDGADDYVSLDSPTTLDDLSPMSIAFWVNPTKAGYIISKRDASCSGYWRIAFYANGKVGILNVKGATTESAVSIPTGVWTHVAYTWDGTNAVSGTKVYINGQDQTGLVTAGANSAASDASCNVYLGSRVGTSDFFGGSLDELHIYGATLSSGEVSQDMNNLATSSTSSAGTTTTTPSNPAPTLSFSASPVSILSGGATTLSWSASNADGCSASGGWSGNLSISGSQSVSPAQSTTYALSCSGAGGSVSKSTTVSVSAPVTQVTSSSGSISLPTLPQVSVDTSMPTQTGQTITVNAGGNLQTAIDNAQPGDTIVLQAGATFTGKITLPLKSNPNNKWIVIKSSQESQLPPPGVRVQPGNSVNMPKIVTTNSDYTIQAAQSASYYRFIGVEVTDNGAPSQYAPTFPDGTKGSYNYGLIELGRAGRDTQLTHLPHHIIFDRSYIHAQPKTSSRRGVVFNGAHQAVIDSYVSDFKEVGADSQAIAGFNGSGPFKIVNNYLEAAGENIMFGGSDPSISNLVASDIEIRGNYVFKPVSWKTGTSNYVGVQWTIKNLLETKNASRMLVEGNVFENSWAQAQTGWAMILRNANQTGGCTWCIGSHFTLRNNIIRNVGAGINIGTSQGTGTTAEPHHMLIENNILENIAVSPFIGDNRGIQVLGNGIADIVIRKNTLYTTGSLTAGLLMEATINNFEYADNINTWGQYGVVKSGGTGESIIPTVVSGVLNYSGNVYIKPTSISSSYGSIFVSTLSAAEATGKGANRAQVNQATQYAISGGGTYTPPLQLLR